jgi:tRNA pseudouridine55 synthase
MRKLLNTKKIGHSGTLDPMAEGVLPVFVGAATKAVDFCPNTDKEYRAAFKFGQITDTQDITGRVLQEFPNCYVPRPRIDKAIKRFTGEIRQIPPMYSAVKVNGKRLYNYARKGLEVERTFRKATIHEIDIEEYGDNKGIMRVACSKGTYIRTLIHDLGLELGFGAVMFGLQRTISNGFTLEDCHTLETLRAVYARNPEKLAELLMPLDTLFKNYPIADLDEEQTHLFKNGAVLNADLVRFERVYDGIYRINDHNGRILALGKIERDHSISIIQRFNYTNEQQPKPPESE